MSLEYGFELVAFRIQRLLDRWRRICGVRNGDLLLEALSGHK